ncbi:flagellar basal-body rod protein FlgF [Geomonas sp. Red32]|uniref:flagellar basal-body rod protein FlgF n=1 Tax=Geomonas sp. Red32 TaxID=2912856 RepID=UPI00202CCCAE|nr:flagellar basal-body rod protein FlgF [Geomonas sp. Red32]MCM0081159.1 flagellar basal-body rod protein FlgF [Geomonas sp. Red32]
MNSGMYAALSGSLTAQRRLDVLTNNLANASTAGFKADTIGFESVLAGVNNPTQQPIFANERYSTDFSQGPLQKSDNTFDLALEGEGFFVVNTPDGPAYTRQGNFQRGPGGKLVTSDGYEVQGGNGPITIANGSRVIIDENGQVNVDGSAVGTISRVDFPKPYSLSKQGNGLWVPADPAAAPAAAQTPVKQGYLEGSNVKVVVEMARMIETSRFFESCARAVRSYDDMAAKAANDLGKV